MRLTSHVTSLCLALAGLLLNPALAHEEGGAGTSSPPAYAPSPSRIPVPRDLPWPGTIALAVDATDLDHRILQVTQTLPVQPGPLTLLYPRWLPGGHGPYGNASQWAGLLIQAGAQRIEWQRDELDPFAFHLSVPAGVRELQLRFQHLSPITSGEGRVSITRQILGVQWHTALLYPAGHYASAIRVQPRLRLPEGWQAATALRAPNGQPARPAAGGWLEFGAVSLETLVDSPVFAGRHTRQLELTDAGSPQPVRLTLLADQADQLEASPAQIEAHRALVRQADALFGPRHFRQYDFLLAQSGEFGGIGLEHHESSENAVRPGYFKDWALAARRRSLLPHEYTHSWNGKFRRPATLWTPQYNEPMRSPLLWVYEGQTQYWGEVLAARSGLVSPEQWRETLAQAAASALHRSGRAWRNLQDTTFEPTLASRGDKPWRDWQRGVDYYDEAALVWLEVDARIRELSAERRSLDDFARAFFGQPHASAADGSIRPLPYTEEDVTRTLAQVQAFDWAALLRERLDGHEAAPLEGLSRAGWRLTWATTESEFARNAEGSGGASGRERAQDLAWSLGLRVAPDGKLESVLWDSPAFRAGLTVGQTVVAVGGWAYKPERLAAAVSANTGGQAPIELLVREGERYRQLTLDWRGGLRYPRLERIDGTVDRLSAIVAPR